MKLLLLNPPHPSIGSRIPREHLPPLGLLSLGGPLIDAGHEVKLLDADLVNMSTSQMVREVVDHSPDAVLLGHSGSTSGHCGVVEVVRQLREAMPSVWIIYGGVYPTYHWREAMSDAPGVDFIVRGEGELTVVRLMEAIANETDPSDVPGIVFREGVSLGVARGYRTEASCGILRETEPAALIRDLDGCRVAWELVDHRSYTYWGGRRAVVAQFSRGCPHGCSYCGQRYFWARWRHRNPERFAAELARLHREEGVEVINFADENPTASRPLWERFLKAMIAENVPLILVGSTRAGDIVRDADILHLYRQAGVARFLMGFESTDEQTLEKIQKGSTKATDREAIRLLRENGIISMVAWVSGFAEERDADYWRTLRQILAYDPDQIQGLYATPHRWTAFGAGERSRRVIQTDLRLWDYKHQVLESPHVPPWRLLIWMKLIEAAVQLRPKSIWRLLFHPDPAYRSAMRWYYGIGRRVWPYEIWNWIFKDKRTKNGPTVDAFWGGEGAVVPVDQAGINSTGVEVEA